MQLQAAECFDILALACYLLLILFKPNPPTLEGKTYKPLNLEITLLVNQNEL